MNLILDKLLSFGRLDPIANGFFPEVANLGVSENPAAGEAKQYPFAGGMTDANLKPVTLLFDTPAGGTSLLVEVLGSDQSDTAAGTWTPVGTNTFTLAQMRHKRCNVAISPNEFKFLAVKVTATGSFTGSVEAILNSFAGK